MPSSARGTSERSAIAFVKHYVDVLNYSSHSFDVGPLAALSSTQCQVCRSLASELQTIGERGGRVVGGEWTTVEAAAIQPPSPDVRLIRILVEYGQQVVTFPSERRKVYAAGRHLYLVEVQPTKRGWRISDFRSNQ